MCKKISTLIVFVIVFVMQVYVHAAVGDGGTYEGFDYTIISDKAVIITKYTGSDTQVNVPEKNERFTIITPNAPKTQPAILRFVSFSSLKKIGASKTPKNAENADNTDVFVADALDTPM